MPSGRNSSNIGGWPIRTLGIAWYCSQQNCRNLSQKRDKTRHMGPQNERMQSIPLSCFKMGIWSWWGRDWHSYTIGHQQTIGVWGTIFPSERVILVSWLPTPILVGWLSLYPFARGVMAKPNNGRMFGCRWHVFFSRGEMGDTHPWHILTLMVLAVHVLARPNMHGNMHALEPKHPKWHPVVSRGDESFVSTWAFHGQEKQTWMGFKWHFLSLGSVAPWRTTGIPLWKLCSDWSKKSVRVWERSSGVFTCFHQQSDNINQTWTLWQWIIRGTISVASLFDDAFPNLSHQSTEFFLIHHQHHSDQMQYCTGDGENNKNMKLSLSGANRKQ